MLTAILWGLARHLLTSVGGALLSYGIQKVCPSCIGAGGAMTVIGAGLSIAHKVTTINAPAENAWVNDKR